MQTPTQVKVVSVKKTKNKFIIVGIVGIIIIITVGFAVYSIAIPKQKSIDQQLSDMNIMAQAGTWNANQVNAQSTYFVQLSSLSQIQMLYQHEGIIEPLQNPNLSVNWNGAYNDAQFDTSAKVVWITVFFSDGMKYCGYYFYQ